MNLFLFLILSSLFAFADSKAVSDFLKDQKLDESGAFNGLDSKPAVIKLVVREKSVHAIVDYVHVERNNYIISLHDIQLVKSTGPITYAGYPVYSTHLLSPPEIEKRGQKFQSYGAISTEEGNGFCRSAFGAEYHLAKQNPTSSRKTENDPWYLESVTCEGPRDIGHLSK